MPRIDKCFKGNLGKMLSILKIEFRGDFKGEEA
jgi:hypothetical protein